MKKELMPPNTKKCGHEGNYSACLCGTYDALLEGVVDTPSLDKSEHDGTCRTPECYEKRPTPAVEDWEEKLKVMILSRGMGVSLNDCVNYVRSLRESDRKRILKWAEKEKRHDILYFSDLVAFITNLK